MTDFLLTVLALLSFLCICSLIVLVTPDNEV